MTMLPPKIKKLPNLRKEKGSVKSPKPKQQIILPPARNGKKFI